MSPKTIGHFVNNKSFAGSSGNTAEPVGTRYLFPRKSNLVLLQRREMHKAGLWRSKNGMCSGPR